jgi:hypothetical protein
MNFSESLNLKHLLDDSQYVDNTDNIRKLKHSVHIRDDIRTLETMKLSNELLRKGQFDDFLELCKTSASFLYNNYTDIFHKVLKDELDLGMMTQLLTVLKLIEDEKIDQHHGSVMAGKILKEMYIDSAMKRGDNLNKEYDAERIEPVVGKPISWKEYKQMST